MAKDPRTLRGASRVLRFGARLLRPRVAFEVVELALLGRKIYKEFRGGLETFRPGLEIERDVEAIEAHMAILAHSFILKRAFPNTGEPGRSVTGATFPALAPGYAALKAKGGLMAAGRRVGPRPPVADQRLTSLTAKSFGVVRQSGGKIALGFSGGRQQKIAEKLQRRNNFWPLAPDERRAVVELGKREAAAMVARRFSATGGKRYRVHVRVN